MCGPRARTNFPYNANESQSTSAKLFSANLMAKLQKCHMTSLEMAKKPVQNGINRTEHIISSQRGNRVKRENEHESPSEYSSSSGSSIKGQELKCLEEDHIDQMIQELLDYDHSVDFCPVMDN